MKSNKSSNRRNGMRIMIQGLANLQKSNLNKTAHQDELRAEVCYLDDSHRKTGNTCTYLPSLNSIPG